MHKRHFLLLIFAFLSLSLVIVSSFVSTEKKSAESVDESIRVPFFTKGMEHYLESVTTPYNVFRKGVEEAREVAWEIPNTDISPVPFDPWVDGKRLYNAVPHDTLKTIPTVIDNVRVINQRPDFPTGCESVSAVMLLNYLGVDISVGEFADHHLDKSNAFYTKNGVLYGPDPYKHFIGDPRVATSFGCMAPVIEKALNSALDDSWSVINNTGMTLEELCREYIDKGLPVVAWITSQMVKIEYIRSWTTPDGESFSWPTNEHCAVLIGYDEDSYYFADPYYENYLKFDKNTAELRFSELGSQSISVLPY